jgi:hypothetical protein
MSNVFLSAFHVILFIAFFFHNSFAQNINDSNQVKGKPRISFGNIVNNDTTTLDNFFMQKRLIVNNEIETNSEILGFTFVTTYKIGAILEFIVSGASIPEDKLNYLKEVMTSGAVILIEKISIRNSLFTGFANPIMIFVK